MKEVLDFRFSRIGEKRMKSHETVDFNHRAHQLIKDKVNTSAYGLCCTCDYFNYQRTTYKTVRSWCSYWMDMAGVPYFPAMVPNTFDPITNCTTYKDKHSMDIHEMKMLAWHIDIIKKPRVATGFQTKKEDNGIEETEIIIEKPDSRGHED